MASNGGKSKNREQGRDGRGNNLCSGSELKQHQKVPGNINQGNLTNKTCDGSDLTTETCTATPLNLNNVSSTLPTETITFSHTSPTTKKTKREPSIPPARMTTNGSTQTVTLHASSSSNRPTETNTFSHSSSTIAKKKTEPSIPPSLMITTGATRTLTLQDSSTRNKKKRQSKSRDDDHSLLGKQSIESTANDYVKDDWLEAIGLWETKQNMTHELKEKNGVDRFSPDSSESVMDDYDSEEEYSDDSSKSS
eukprot:scaffold32918_cov56-Cyclotella_meneghiniana.AAC.1